MNETISVIFKHRGNVKSINSYLEMFQIMQDPSELAEMASISSLETRRQTTAPVCSLMVVKSLGLELGLKKLTRQVRICPSLPPVIKDCLKSAMEVTPFT